MMARHAQTRNKCSALLLRHGSGPGPLVRRSWTRRGDGHSRLATMDSSYQQLFEALTRSGAYQEYQRAFTEATHLPLALRSPDSWQLPFHGQPNENPFCALLWQASRACAMCLQMQQQLRRKA